MKKLFAMLMMAAAMASPAYAYEVGDSIKFPYGKSVESSSVGCMMLGDARQIPFNGTERERLDYQRSLDVFSIHGPRNFPPKTESESQAYEAALEAGTVRFCAVLSPEHEFHDYFVAKRSNDGYVCVRAREKGWAGCLWTQEPRP
jgi:hypothetical protein